MTQSHLILKHLKKRKSITPLEALSRFGCFRLGARIYDLKRDGHVIETRMVERRGKRFAEYRLVRA